MSTIDKLRDFKYILLENGTAGLCSIHPLMSRLSVQSLLLDDRRDGAHHALSLLFVLLYDSDNLDGGG